MKIKLLILLSLMHLSVQHTFSQNNNTIEMMTDIIDSINNITAISYIETHKVNQPEDTSEYNILNKSVTFCINENDTIFGAKFYTSSLDSSRQEGDLYDGQNVVRLDFNKKTAIADTAEYGVCGIPLPPLFIMSKSLLQYSIENKESIDITIKSDNDSSIIEFLFKDKFFGFFSIIPIEKSYPGIDTKYILWIDKNYLPYKIGRLHPSQNFWIYYSEIIPTNKIDNSYDALENIPDGFKLEWQDFIREK